MCWVDVQTSSWAATVGCRYATCEYCPARAGTIATQDYDAISDFHWSVCILSAKVFTRLPSLCFAGAYVSQGQKYGAEFQLLLVYGLTSFCPSAPIVSVDLVTWILTIMGSNREKLKATRYTHIHLRVVCSGFILLYRVLKGHLESSALTALGVDACVSNRRGAN